MQNMSNMRVADEQGGTHRSGVNVPLLAVLALVALLMGWIALSATAGTQSSTLLALALPALPLCTSPACDQGSSEQQRAIKLAAYQEAMDIRLPLLHNASKLIMPNLWDLLAPLWWCDGPLERLGEPGDGGKWMCDVNATLAEQPCVVLSMGSNAMTEWEEAVLARAPHCDVHTFDHTLSPDGQAKVANVSGVTFHPLGITSEADLEAMQNANASALAANFTTVRGAIEATGSDWVEVLKIDIEGSEWPVFKELLDSNDTIPITQILVELHLPLLKDYRDIYPGRAMQSVVALFDGFWRHGYKAFANEPNMHSGHPIEYTEYSFIKTDEWGNTVSRSS